MKLAAIQFKPKKGDRAAAKQALAALITEAGQQGAALIVCPEMALSGYLFSDALDALTVAELVRGDSLTFLAELAKRYRAYIVCGYPELAPIQEQEDGRLRLYNSARVVGPDGELVYNYRKRLLYDSDFTWATPGDTLYPMLDVGFSQKGRLNVGICMDLNDNRYTEFLRREKPRFVAFCTNWLDEGEKVLPYWQHRLRGTESYFLAANTYGDEEAFGHAKTRFSGGSAILAPGGRLLASAPREGDAVVLYELSDE